MANPLSYIDLQDPIALTKALVEIPSVTPDQGPAIDLIARWLQDLGFELSFFPFGEGSNLVQNLYARLHHTTKKGAKCLCFAGHSDVVPVGDHHDWSHDPFKADIRGKYIYGRGVADMKGAIAAFIAAVAQLQKQNKLPDGDIALLITGDEEGPSIHGMKPMLEALSLKGEKWNGCITGEPTNPSFLGEAMKIGRRGSLQGTFTAFGKQGHTGYPQLADNAAHRIVKLCQSLLDIEFDNGSDFFEHSTLAISSIDIGNSGKNIIPAKAVAYFNIRFNELHSGQSLIELIQGVLSKIESPDTFQLDFHISGESFLTEPGALSQAISEGAFAVTGHRPELSTKGGTSDSRFIKNYCPVVDFGLVGRSMHMVDEEIECEDLNRLCQIYQHTIINFLT